MSTEHKNKFHGLACRLIGTTVLLSSHRYGLATTSLVYGFFFLSYFTSNFCGVCSVFGCSPERPLKGIKDKGNQGQDVIKGLRLLMYITPVPKSASRSDNVLLD